MRSAASTRIIFRIVFCCAVLGASPAFSGQAVPPPDLLPLNQIPVPEPPSLFQFVKDKQAAIRLGKAFFWDMQAGSDGIQACGSCHFSAGADNRMKNTVNPGTRGGDVTFQVRGPNETLLPADFPFHQRQDPNSQGSPVLRDLNDVVGSQGVKLNRFAAVVPGSAVEAGVPVPDPVFQAGGANLRRVTGRNTPSVINAVFNFSNFWDGRAHFLFNGESPYGPLDPSAGVWYQAGGVLQKQPVAIQFASLASQATGPPLDDAEMSYTGRTFPDLGRKLLSLTPLGKQLVHPGDGVLGPLSRSAQRQDGTLAPDKGLKVTYRQMIQDAFQNALWSAPGTTPDGFTQMEANFPLFWGLSIQLYEATLVSDQSRFDRFLGGDRDALTSQEQDGFNLFFGPAGCSVCHFGSELTQASARSAGFVTNATHALIEPMVVADGDQIIYDNGFNNTGVRPTGEDIGRGGHGPFDNPLTGLPFPLSYSALAELQAIGSLGYNPLLFPFGTLATPVLPQELPPDFPVANDGNFKIPGLRNVELTSPYFHDGGVRTLEEVVEFYARGGNFPLVNEASLDPAMVPLGILQNSGGKQAALVAFLKSMTDERVRLSKAPFDHPEIFVPNGEPDFIAVPARDAAGNAAPALGVTINPVLSPTSQAVQTIGGTVDAGATVTVSLDTQATAGAVSVSGGSWSAQLSGLARGVNTVSVTALKDGVSATVQAVIMLNPPPSLTLNAPASPSNSPAQTLGGTVEPGVTPVVLATTAASVGPVQVNGGAWSCTVSNLAVGANGITVLALDALGGLAVRTATLDFEPSDGDASRDGSVDISDALFALRVAVGLVLPGAAQKLRADVAPLVNGRPAPDGAVDVADALAILRKVVALENF